MQHAVFNGLLSAMHICKLSSRHSDLTSIWPSKSLHEELRRRQNQSLPLSSLKALNAGRSEAWPTVKPLSTVNTQQLRNLFSCSQPEEQLNAKTGPLPHQEEQPQRAAYMNVLNCANHNLFLNSMLTIGQDQVGSNIVGAMGRGPQHGQNWACGSARRCHHCSGEGYIVAPSLVDTSLTGNQPQVQFEPPQTPHIQDTITK